MRGREKEKTVRSPGSLPEMRGRKKEKTVRSLRSLRSLPEMRGSRMKELRWRSNQEQDPERSAECWRRPV